MIRYTVSLIAFFTLISCQQSATLTEDEGKAIIADVQKTINNYYNDIRTSGLTSEFKYLDSSSDFFWVPPGYDHALSYDSVASILRHNASSVRSVNNTIDTIKIVPLNKELATYTARLSSTVTDSAGETSAFSLVETGLMIKRKDGWKLLSGQTSVIE